MYRFVAGCVFAAFILTTGIEAMTDTGVGHMYKLPVTQVSKAVVHYSCMMDF
jgi:hypothetical protein